MSTESYDTVSEYDPPLPKGWGLIRTRSRLIGQSAVSGTLTRQLSSAPATVTTTVFPASGMERTVDAKHWAWKYAKRTPFAEWDTGGDFDSRKVYVEPAHGQFARTQQGRTLESYSGALFAHSNVLELMKGLSKPLKPTLPFPYAGDSVAASSNELRTRGATAIARTLPTAPSVNVAASLGELREGLPSLTGRALGRGDAGGEFLNYQFGIAPTVSDISAYRAAYAKSEETLAQWRRYSGRRVRRRYTFAVDEPEVTVTTGTGILTGTHGGFPYAAVNTGGVTEITRTRTQRFWFSGAYRYFVPEVASSWQRKLHDLTRTYGVPTPDALWQLSQFSWLVDWETNVGDVITNASNLGHDDLVLTYGYIMCHTQVTYDYVWKGQVYFGTVPSPLEVRNRVVMDTKQRVRASPYGLGWTTDALSDRQIAILAALGYSRSSG